MALWRRFYPGQRSMLVVPANVTHNWKEEVWHLLRVIACILLGIVSCTHCGYAAMFIFLEDCAT